MKLATYKDGSRDGQLVVVARDLTTAHYASGIASRLQQVLDDWNFLSPQLEDLATTLNQGKARHAFPFDPTLCMAPLPRAYLRACAVPGATLRLAQGGSDDLLGPMDDIVCAAGDLGIEVTAELAVVTGDVALGSDDAAALEGIRLVMLANAVSLRDLIPPQQNNPATAFSPVAVTPDELTDAWHGGRVHLNPELQWNGKRVGLGDAGPEMAFHFGQLIAHLCKTRRVRAGSIIGWGGPTTGVLTFGDTVRTEVKGPGGASVFGAIAQRVRPLS
jgi:fumarylacetoacetate (FAA) hydrolase